jgi:hypothetical protein
MLVRSLCNHYRNGYRKEGEEFKHTGPLYEHIEPVDPAEKAKLGKQAKTRQDEE